MRVELLPSSLPASDAQCSGAQFLVSYLVDDAVAIDAGSLGLLADLRRQERVRHVVVTHEHIDHIATLPIFLENVYAPGPDCVELLATEDVLDFLHRDIFNGRVWPDFFALSTGDDRFVHGTPLTAHEPLTRAGLTLTPLPVSHVEGSLGVLVDDGHAAVAFPSDTGPTDHFWRHIATCDRLQAVFLEVSFPDGMADLAAVTGHHCPRSFAAEIRKLESDVRWIVVHRKARYAAEIARELAALGLKNVELVEPGHVYEF
jgi:cAMP phosphodiesterase